MLCITYKPLCKKESKSILFNGFTFLLFGQKQSRDNNGDDNKYSES